MNALLQDLRFALRQVRRSPGFTATAVLILALGIAANVIVFDVLQELILQPLDIPRVDRAVTFAPRVSGYPIFSYPEVRDVRDDSTVFSAVAAEAMEVFGLEVNGTTSPVWGSEVSGQYFEAIGIQPFAGRLLQPSDDDHPQASEAAVITWSSWKSHFAGDPNIVGKIVRINKHPYTIVGITPEGFYGTQKFLASDLFVPMANQASLDGVNWLEDRSNKMVFPIARLKDGVTLAQAQGELDRTAALIAKRDPKEEEGVAFKLAPPGLIGNFVRGAMGRFLGGVMGLAFIVLLAACANLGGLFAARTADRTREIAIRVAIGSSQWRIVRQVLMEAFVISMLGCACACGLSWIALTSLATWHPPTDYPVRFALHPQPSLLLMAFLVSMIAGALFGLMPLGQILKTDPNEAIKGGGSGGGQMSGAGRWKLRDVLLAAQVALCCVTVTAAFVSLRGLHKALATDIGIQPRNATLTKFDLSQAAYTGDSAAQFQRQLQERIEHLPGVEAVGYANGTPLADTPSTAIFKQETSDMRPSNEAFDSFFYAISPGYLAAAGTTLVEGRNFRPTDTAKTPAVAIVNRQFARSLFHVDHAVGRYFKNHTGALVQIVGMVADGKYFLTSEDPQEAVYVPILQQPSTMTSVVVRTRGDGSGMVATDMAVTVRKMVRDLDPAVPIRSSGTWTNQLAFSFFPAQAATVALSLFGVFGLLLSITGTFGLASYTVGKRMRELSIRVALGAQRKQILSAALGRMLILIGTGSAIGMGLGVATSGLLSHIVYQASAQDPFVLAAVLFTVLVTGLLSVAGPVHRALHAEPASLMREQ
jgi:predicted permease